MDTEFIQQLSRQLQRYLPAGTETLCARWLVSHNTSLRITRSRKTKLGDFRPQPAPVPHRISINGDLAPLQFLVTFAHEIAHTITWDQYKNSVASHGVEWKRCYQTLLTELLELNVLTDDAALALQQHSRKPAATSSVNCPIHKLTHPLHDGPLLDELKPGQVFSLGDGRIFQIVRKLRSHWHCMELSTGRDYRVHGQTPIIVTKP